MLRRLRKGLQHRVAACSPRDSPARGWRNVVAEAGIDLDLPREYDVDLYLSFDAARPVASIFGSAPTIG